MDFSIKIINVCDEKICVYPVEDIEKDYSRPAMAACHEYHANHYVAVKYLNNAAADIYEKVNTDKYIIKIYNKKGQEVSCYLDAIMGGVYSFYNKYLDIYRQQVSTDSKGVSIPTTGVLLYQNQEKKFNVTFWYKQVGHDLYIEFSNDFYYFDNQFVTPKDSNLEFFFINLCDKFIVAEVADLPQFKLIKECEYSVFQRYSEEYDANVVIYYEDTSTDSFKKTNVIIPMVYYKDLGRLIQGSGSACVVASIHKKYFSSTARGDSLFIGCSSLDDNYNYNILIKPRSFRVSTIIARNPITAAREGEARYISSKGKPYHRQTITELIDELIGLDANNESELNKLITHLNERLSKSIEIINRISNKNRSEWAQNKLQDLIDYLIKKQEIVKDIYNQKLNPKPRDPLKSLLTLDKTDAVFIIERCVQSIEKIHHILTGLPKISVPVSDALDILNNEKTRVLTIQSLLVSSTHKSPIPVSDLDDCAIYHCESRLANHLRESHDL